MVDIDSFANKPAKLLLEPFGVGHQALGSCVAVVDTYAIVGQQPAEVALATPYPTSDSYLHGCSMR